MLCFETITEPKKKRLLQAALEAFSDNVYDKVSVFSIAKKAGVSRTSFYYYFADKQQLYRALLKSLQQDFITWLQKEKQQLDLFEMMLALFAYFSSYRGTEQQGLIKNITANMTPTLQDEFIHLVKEGFSLDEWRQMRDADRLKIHSPEEITLLLLMLLNCVDIAIQQYFAHAQSKQKVEHYLKMSMDFIKYGVYKES